MTTLDRPLRPRRILGPLVLIGIGVLFLLGNLGLPAWRFWETLLYLWPVLLIAAGLELLVGRRAPWAGWLIALIAVGVLLGGMLLNPRTVGGSLVSEQWATPVGTAQTARVELALGAGTLKLAGVDDSTTLLSAALERASSATLEHTARLDGTTAVVVVRERQRTTVLPLGGTAGHTPTWDLKLSTALPTALTINAGAGQTNLELSALKLTQLDVSTGAGQTLLRLPPSGSYQASVSTGAGQTIITLPQALAAQIHVANGLGDRRVTGDYVRTGDSYVSPGYATATNRVELNVSGGVGSIRIQQEPTP